MLATLPLVCIAVLLLGVRALEDAIEEVDHDHVRGKILLEDAMKGDFSGVRHILEHGVRYAALFFAS